MSGHGLFWTDTEKWKTPVKKWACAICGKQSTRIRTVKGASVVICQNCEEAKCKTK